MQATDSKDPAGGLAGFNVVVSGTIDNARVTGTDTLAVRYAFTWGQDWSVIDGVHEGMSQFASSGGKDRIAINMPLDVALHSTNPFGWPRLVVIVGSLSMLRSFSVVGYGSVLLPTTPGRHKRRIRLFTPVSSTSLQSLLGWLFNRSPVFADFKFVAEQSGREVTRVRATGDCDVTLNVLTQGMAAHGLQTSPLMVAPAAAAAAPAAAGAPATPGAGASVFGASLGGDSVLEPVAGRALTVLVRLTVAREAANRLLAREVGARTGLERWPDELQDSACSRQFDLHTKYYSAKLQCTAAVLQQAPDAAALPAAARASEAALLVVDSQVPVPQLAAAAACLDEAGTSPSTKLLLSIKPRLAGEAAAGGGGDGGGEQAEEGLSPHLEWSIDNGWECVDVMEGKSPLEGLKDRDKEGVPRVLEALQSQMWGSAVMGAPAARAAAPAAKAGTAAPAAQVADQGAGGDETVPGLAADGTAADGGDLSSALDQPVVAQSAAASGQPGAAASSLLSELLQGMGGDEDADLGLGGVERLLAEAQQVRAASLSGRGSASQRKAEAARVAMALMEAMMGMDDGAAADDDDDGGGGDDAEEQEDEGEQEEAGKGERVEADGGAPQEDEARR